MKLPFHCHFGMYLKSNSVSYSCCISIRFLFFGCEKCAEHGYCQLNQHVFCPFGEIRIYYCGLRTRNLYHSNRDLRMWITDPRGLQRISSYCICNKFLELYANTESQTLNYSYISPPPKKKLIVKPLMN